MLIACRVRSADVFPITAVSTAFHWYVSVLNTDFLFRMSLFQVTYKKNWDTIGLHVPCSSSHRAQPHRCFLVNGWSLHMMMLFPNKAHITHLQGEQVWIPLQNWLKNAEWVGNCRSKKTQPFCKKQMYLEEYSWQLLVEDCCRWIV